MELYLSTLGIPFPYITGTPVANQVTVFTSATQVQGSADFTFVSSAGLVVNESGGATADVRFEGDTLPNLFLVDASADRVFITDAASDGTPPTNPTGGYNGGTLFAIVNNSVVGDNVVLALVAGNVGNSVIEFGDADNVASGRIDYEHNGDFFTVRAGGLEMWRLYSSIGSVFNEEAQSTTDFRVETQNLPNFFFIDSSADRLYISDKAGYHTPPTAPTGGYDAGTLLAVVNNSAVTDNAVVALIAGATSGLSALHFGDSGDADIGYVSYDHSANALSLGTNTALGIIIDSAQKVAINVATAGAQLHVVQDVSDAAIPVLELHQDDIDEPFIEFDGASAGDLSSPITTLAGGAVTEHIRVSINGVDRWIPLVTTPA